MNEKELRQKAVEKSIVKWEAYSKGLRPRDTTCGFCWYVCKKIHKTYFANRSCKKYCPLFSDICSNENLYEGQLYWKYGNFGNSKSIDEKIAKDMLEVIKKRGKKWIASSKE